MQNYLDRYRVVRRGFWWTIQIGDGTETYGRFYRYTEAQKFAQLLQREFLNGRFLSQKFIDEAKQTTTKYESS